MGNIATSGGFHQMSHFGKCFKEKQAALPENIENQMYTLTLSWIKFFKRSL